jgi:hypothetical protein
MVMQHPAKVQSGQIVQWEFDPPLLLHKLGGCMKEMDVRCVYTQDFIHGHTCTLTHVPSGLIAIAKDMNRRVAYQKAYDELRLKVFLRWKDEERK